MHAWLRVTSKLVKQVSIFNYNRLAEKVFRVILLTFGFIFLSMLNLFSYLGFYFHGLFTFIILFPYPVKASIRTPVYLFERNKN